MEELWEGFYMITQMVLYAKICSHKCLSVIYQHVHHKCFDFSDVVFGINDEERYTVYKATNIIVQSDFVH